MSDTVALQGLSCPRCGGMIPIPEGQEIVCCPYCDLRSVVRGDRGLRRYQVPCRVDRNQAAAAFQQFLGSNWAIARDARGSAKLNEAFVAYLPFWAAWGRALSWAFGEERVGSGDHKRWEPREVRFAEEMSWNGAACDVGEFGVTQVPLNDQQLEPFKGETLHSSGMVFEPVGSQTDARAAAKDAFQERIRSKTRLDRLSQHFVRVDPRAAGTWSTTPCGSSVTSTAGGLSSRRRMGIPVKSLREGAGTTPIGLPVLARRDGGRGVRIHRHPRRSFPAATTTRPAAR